MGGIDRLNDAIVGGMAQHPEFGLDCRRLVTRGKSGLMIAQGVFALALVRLALAKAAGKVDLLHIHLSVRGSSWRKSLLAAAARRLGIPYVVHLHGTDYREFWEGSRGPLRAGIDSMFNGAARIIVLGEFWAAVVRDLAPAVSGKIVVLPNATEPVARRPAREPGGTDPVRITFLGQIGERKGAGDLISALGTLGGLGNWTATLAGDGEVEAARRQVTETGLAGRVAVPGWLDAESRNRLLEKTDVLVLPSRAENLPMVLLEAFAHGIATVMTPVGAIPEVVEGGRNGLLVEPGNVEAIAGALARLIADRELRLRLGREAARDHAARFEIGQYLARLAGTWREIVPVRGAGSKPASRTATSIGEC
jgi:glycosyltransferase involved in cell wall biosynthesis